MTNSVGAVARSLTVLRPHRCYESAGYPGFTRVITHACVNWKLLTSAHKCSVTAALPRACNVAKKNPLLPI